jgi:hypothetical protein
MALTIVFAVLGALAVWWLYKAFTLPRQPLVINRPSRPAPEEFKNFEWEPHECNTTVYMSEETMQEFESLLKGSKNGDEANGKDGKS